MNFLFLVVALSLIGSLAQAQVVGTVEKIEGAPEVKRSGTSNWSSIKNADTVAIGDQLRTREGTKMAIRMSDDSMLTLAEKTVITIDDQTLKPSGQNTSIFSLLLGKVRAVVSDRYKEPGSRFEVRTPTAVAGVRGTEFIAEATADESQFFGLESETVVHLRAFGICERAKGCRG